MTANLHTLEEADRDLMHSRPVLSEWEKARMFKFTSSKMGDLMTQGRRKDDLWGLAADKYIFEKIGELMTGVPHFVPETNAMAWGNQYEQEAMEFHNNLHPKMQIDMMGTTFVQFNDMAGGSPDGYIGDDWIVEVKCPYVTANHIKWLVTGEIDDKGYEFQCQANMLFTGRNKARFISYDPRIENDKLKLAVIDIQRDEDICSAIQDRIDQATNRLIGICERFDIDYEALKSKL